MLQLEAERWRSRLVVAAALSLPVFLWSMGSMMWPPWMEWDMGFRLVNALPVSWVLMLVLATVVQVGGKTGAMGERGGTHGFLGGGLHGFLGGGGTRGMATIVQWEGAWGPWGEGGDTWLWVGGLRGFLRGRGDEGHGNSTAVQVRGGAMGWFGYLAFFWGGGGKSLEEDEGEKGTGKECVLGVNAAGQKGKAGLHCVALLGRGEVQAALQACRSGWLMHCRCLGC